MSNYLFNVKGSYFLKVKAGFSCKLDWLDSYQLTFQIDFIFSGTILYKQYTHVP